MEVTSALLVNVMNLTMLFLMVIFTKSTLLNITFLLEVTIVMVVILNNKLLIIQEIIILYQLKAIVLSNEYIN